NPVGTFDDVTDGWTIALISADDVTITHNLGRAPVGGMFFGNFPSGTNYRNRFIGSTAADLVYDSTNQNVCNINNVTTTNAGALSSSHCYV
ncbi:hypothetical protein, partial [Escherichia coli]|uniref:hypothetical protein n=1 Tax=Escherichia coli TaxID=562 RepID=UPI00196410C9